MIIKLKRHILILLLILVSGCAGSSRWSEDPFYKHFEKPYSIVWGTTVQKLVENEKLIAFWYLRNYVTKDELTTVAKIHCESHNKSVHSVEYTYYNNSSTGAIFECK